jgi:hypothetical protein
LSFEGVDMRTARFGLLLCLMLLDISVWGQQAPTPAIQPQLTIPQQAQQVTTPPPAPKDPQAVSVLNQVLSVGGGAAAIKAVTDYTGTGNITYNWNPVEQGSVTVMGLGFDQFRVDANLSRGVHSSVISAGQTTTKTQEGVISQYPPPYPVPSSDAFPYQPPMFPGSLVLPHAQLVAVLNSPRFSVSYKGLVQVDGHPAHDIQVLRVLPGPTDVMSEYHTRDFFVDASTLQVVMTQEMVPKNVVRVIRYSDYRTVSGVLAPFSISEEMGGQQTWAIQLSRITFNAGLQGASFAVE